MTDSSDIRGVILSADFRPTPDGGVQVLNFGTPYIEADVKSRLPYWDRIVLPATPMIKYELSPDLEFLVAEGVVSEPDLQFQGNWTGMAEMWAVAQLTIFKAHDGEHPGQWAMAQRGSGFWLPSDGLPTGRSVELQLYDSVPAPGPDVSIDDILSFKSKRASELAAFRSLMDEMYLSIVNSNDVPRSRVAAISRIERALLDLDHAANESWTSKLMSSLKMTIPLKDLAERGLFGAAAAASFGLPMTAGAVAGVAYGALSFDFKAFAFKSRVPPSAIPMLYAHKVASELSHDPK